MHLQAAAMDLKFFVFLRSCTPSCSGSLFLHDLRSHFLFTFIFLIVPFFLVLFLLLVFLVSVFWSWISWLCPNVLEIVPAFWHQWLLVLLEILTFSGKDIRLMIPRLAKSMLSLKAIKQVVQSLLSTFFINLRQHREVMTSIYSTKRNNGKVFLHPKYFWRKKWNLQFAWGQWIHCKKQALKGRHSSPEACKCAPNGQILLASRKKIRFQQQYEKEAQVECPKQRKYSFSSTSQFSSSVFFVKISSAAANLLKYASSSFTSGGHIPDARCWNHLQAAAPCSKVVSEIVPNLFGPMTCSVFPFCDVLLHVFDTIWQKVVSWDFSNHEETLLLSALQDGAYHVFPGQRHSSQHLQQSCCQQMLHIKLSRSVSQLLLLESLDEIQTDEMHPSKVWLELSKWS